MLKRWWRMRASSVADIRRLFMNSMKVSRNAVAANIDPAAAPIGTMKGADFLFPTDLAATPTPLSKVLIVGSCQAESYYESILRFRPGVSVDIITTNNLSDLPALPPSPISEYDLQFVQIALRAVIGDEIVRFRDYGPKEMEALFERASMGLKLRADAALKYAREYGILTVFGNFNVPQQPVTRSLADYGSSTDLTEIVRRLNRQLTEIIGNYENVYLCDIDAITSSLGKRYSLDDVISFFNHATHRRVEDNVYDTSGVSGGPRIDPLPALEHVYELRFDELFDAIYRQWEFVYRVVNQVDQVKLVIFDLDDTLWRGQIAEHYGDESKWPVEHGWPAGVWEAVHHLRARGILTAICSRNEASIVEERWARAVGSGWIHPDHFISKAINWRPKAENIAVIIEAANLTPKSVVFVDDNPVEREAVRSALPGIRVIGSNPYLTRRILLWSAETQVARLNEESAEREDMVKKQQKREAMRKVVSREDFLADLEAKIELLEVTSVKAPAYGRMLELLNKTNQFNTTGRRWAHREMVEFLAQGGKLFGFRVSDRFTNYGLVGVIPYRYGRFEQFVMSCRVLGLDVETSVVRQIMRAEAGSGWSGAFHAVVVPTDVNIVCRSIYAQCGFQADPNDGTRFVHDGDDILPSASHLQWA